MVKSIWQNIFEKEILTDNSTIKYEEDEYRTSITDVSNENNIIVESRSVSAENFVLPSRSYLLIRFKLVKADGTNYANGDNMTLLNGWSLFSRVELLLNGASVDIVDFPGHVDTILGLLEDPEDYEAKGSLQYRYYDTKNGTDNATETEIRSDTLAHYLSANMGQAARVARCQTTGSQDAWIKLPLRNVLGICKCDKPMRGVQVQLRLTKETNYNRNLLRAAGAADGRTVISKVSLIMPTAKPHLDIFAEINKRLVSKERIPIDYQRIWCNFYTGLTGTDLVQRLLSNTRRPRHVFLAISAAARIADQTRNALTYDLPAGVRGSVKVGNVYFLQQF